MTDFSIYLLGEYNEKLFYLYLIYLYLIYT
jgi:hypothetical protein